MYRFARIVPCLVGLLIILTGLHFWGAKGYVISPKFGYLEALFSALTFHLNWLEGMKGYLPPSWDVLWSLSVEEMFYIAFPLVCFATKRKELIYLALVMLIIIGPLNRLALQENRIWQSKAYLSCMDSIAIGCLFAMLSHNKRISKLFIWLFFIVGTVLITFVLMVKRDAAFSFIADVHIFKTILSLGVGLLLVSGVRQRLKIVPKSLVSPIILYGRFSYEVYLTHSFVVISAVSLFNNYDVEVGDSIPWLFGVIFLSGLLGYLVERYFSRPMNLWIRGKF